MGMSSGDGRQVDPRRGLNFHRIPLSSELEVTRPSREEAAELRDLLLREREAEREVLTLALSGFKQRGIWCFKTPQAALTDCRFECMCAQTFELSRQVMDIPTEHLTDLLKLPKQSSMLAKVFPKWAFARSRTLWRYQQPSDREILAHPKLAGTLRVGVMNFLNDPTSDTRSFAQVVARSSKRVAALFRFIRASIHRHLIHISGWISLHILPLYFSHLVITDRHAAMLRQLQQLRLPIIFLPLHRSYLDYMLLSYVLWRLDLPQTFAAASDNLAVIGIGGILRAFGSFFVRHRPAEGDPIYKALLQTYLERLMCAGHSLELYVEAGRSRTGRCRAPQSDLLAMADLACSQGPVKDAVLLPMSWSYDCPPDAAFGPERMGAPKRPPTLWNILRSMWSFLTSHHGGMRISFAHPVLLSQFRHSLATRATNIDGATSLGNVPANSPSNALNSGGPNNALNSGGPSNALDIGGPSNDLVNGGLSNDHDNGGLGNNLDNDGLSNDLDNSPSNVLGADLAAHSLFFARRAMPLTGTHLCAFLLLTRHRDGASLAVFTRSFAALSRQLGATCALALPAVPGATEAVVESAVALLSRFLSLQRSREGRLAWLAPLLDDSRPALGLSYFAAHVTEALALDCAKAAALVALGRLAPAGVPAASRLHRHRPLSVPLSRWRDAVALLMRLLGPQLAFRPPCVAAEVAIGRDSSLWRSLLHDGESDARSRQQEVLEVDLGRSGVRDTLAELCLALGPQLEASWSVCRVLYELPCEGGVTHEAEIGRRAMALLRRRREAGILLFVESQCLETILSCLRGLEDLAIIERCSSIGDTVAVGLLDTPKLLELMALLEASILRP